MARPKGSKNKPKAGKVAKGAGKAAKPKAAAPAPAQANPKIAADVKLITENNLKSLLRSINSLTKDKDKAVGSIREKIGYAKANQHLHTGAFAWIRKLDKMEPEEAALFLDHFGHMLIASGIQAKIDQVQDLPLSEPASDDADDEGEDETGGETGGETGDAEVSQPQGAGNVTSLAQRAAAKSA